MTNSFLVARGHPDSSPDSDSLRTNVPKTPKEGPGDGPTADVRMSTVPNIEKATILNWGISSH
eukprot:5631973-Alexandrium_andersonii.AAC.1